MSSTDRFDRDRFVRDVVWNNGLVFGLAGWLPDDPIVYGTNRDQRGYHAHAFSQVWARFRLDDQDDDVAERMFSEEQAEDTEETCVRALLRNGALGGGLGRKGKR